MWFNSLEILKRLYFDFCSAYNVMMSKFIAKNGKEVEKFITSSGVVGYVDTSIPMGALIGLRDKLAEKIAHRTAAERLTKQKSSSNK